MNTKGKVAAAAMLAGLAAFGTIPTASATTAYTSFTVYANLDGDSAKDRVTVSTAPGFDTRVQFKLDDGRTAERTVNSGAVYHPIIFDTNADGRDEVAVLVDAGANTAWYDVYRYDPAYGVRAVRGQNGSAFRFSEGGSVYERTEYACKHASSGPKFQQITAESNDAEHWNIKRRTYSVSLNAILPFSSDSFVNVSSNHPLMNLDPTTCN